MTTDDYLSKFPDAEIISDEQRAKMSERGKATFKNEKNRERVSNLFRDKWKDPEFREKKSQQARDRLNEKWKDEEYRNHISECSSRQIREQWKDDNFRKAVSESSKKRLDESWLDPEYRERISKVRKETWERPEYRDIMKLHLEERWKDPEYKAYMKAHISSALYDKWNNDEEYRTHMTEVIQERWRRLWADPEYREYASTSSSIRMKNLWKDEDYRSMMIDMFRERWKNPEFRSMMISITKERWRDISLRHNMNEGTINNIISNGEVVLDDLLYHICYGKSYHNYVYVSKKFNTRFLCRCKSELDFVLKCEKIDSIKSLVYEPFTVELDDGVYIPDYIINDKYLVELKTKIDPNEEDDYIDICRNYCSDNHLIYCWMKGEDVKNVISEESISKFSIMKAG